MQMKGITRAILITGLALTLGACSSMGKKPQTNADVYDGNNGAATAGIGQDNSISAEGYGPSDLHAYRTYYFDFDRSEVHSSDMAAIYANADYLIAHPQQKVVVEGHTDPRGSREYNVALGERRANSVAEILKARGVNASQIQVVSYGAERLAVPGHSEEDFQKDRRVVINYLQG